MPTYKIIVKQKAFGRTHLIDSDEVKCKNKSEANRIAKDILSFNRKSHPFMNLESYVKKM